MDKETKNQEKPSLLSNNNTNKEDSSPKKHPGSSAVSGGGGGGGAGGGGGGSNDRLKRDEWSEGAVSSLLEAYESKWVLRNRAKLKGHDWEDVARYVSARANCAKSPKTQTQCKNKIESMKKRYRSESATAEGSSWPLYQRLDLLLRGNAAVPPTPPLLLSPQQLQVHTLAVPQIQPPGPVFTNLPLTIPEASTVVVVKQQQQSLVTVAQPPTLAPQGLGTAPNSHGSNGFEKTPKDDGVETKVSDHLSDKVPMETDSSTPNLYNNEENLRSKKSKTTTSKKKKRKNEYSEINESIRILTKVVLKLEEARMEILREIEKMRVETEIRRGEMDLKRTEIIAKTQLEIAKLFAGTSKGIDPALRIGRS